MYNSIAGTLSPMLLMRRAALVILGVAVLTLSAKISIPFWPVPMTLQTLAIMGFAVTLGARGAVAVLMAYLAAGAMGLPVFTGTPARGIGLAYMVGPTGGYLLGYVVAAAVVGRLAAGRGVWGRFAAMLIGMVPVYAFGAAWLANFVPVERIWAAGVAPFLLGDFLKIALVALGVSAAARLRTFGR
ncbi:biotin transporter BioY [Lacibacterium aquatile]|uniref:Biotin transporter n=1 Tax=Lacibacterium aquatile TaxID=1168082 RepID=A0ABW5DRA0_9PROT